MMDDDDTRICTSCAQEKSVCEFYAKHRNGKPFDNSRCKACDLKRAAERAKSRHSSRGLARVEIANRLQLLYDLEIMAVNTLAEKYGVATSTIYMWRRTARTGQNIFAKPKISMTTSSIQET
jgi:hypothetical protein